MEKRKTQSEARKEEFDRHADIARRLAQTALEGIDEVLGEYYGSSVTNYGIVLKQAVQRGDISIKEATDALDDYVAWINKEDRQPITDSDTLAEPLGYYGTESLYE